MLYIKKVLGDLLAASALVVAVPFSLQPTQAQAQISIAGEWISSEGRIAFIQSGSSVSGAYELEEGLIDGSISGNVLTGYWSQSRSLLLIHCNAPRKGRYAWGRIRFVFNGSSFKGYWGYCNDEPSSSWSGTQIR
jgi:hypothetical protein